MKQKIIVDIKKDKYDGIILDSTPDESKMEQMIKSIRYVLVEDVTVKVRESFLGFFYVWKNCKGYVKRRLASAGKRWVGYCVVQGSRL